MDKIEHFEDEYKFLSNFWYVTIPYEGISYPSTEHAYQAVKTLRIHDRLAVAKLPSCGQAKRAGRNLSLRPDWEEVKFKVMEDVLRIKFAYPNLREKLLATGAKELVEGNYWNDTIWGVCNNVGENHLGKLLMKIRSELTV